MGGVFSSIAKVSLGVVLIFLTLTQAIGQTPIVNTCGDCQTVPGSPGISFVSVLGNGQSSSSFTLTAGAATIETNSPYSVGFGEDVNIIGSDYSLASGQNLTLEGLSNSYLFGKGDDPSDPLILGESEAFGIGFNADVPQFIARFNSNSGSGPVKEQFQISVGEVNPPDAASIFARGGLITQSTNTGNPIPGTGIWNSLGQSPIAFGALPVNGTRSQWGDFGFLSGVEDPVNGGSAFIGWADERTLNKSQRLRIGPIEGNNFLERMTVLYNGNVGIETATPDRKLQVAGNTRINEGLSVGDNGSASGATGVLEVGQDNSVNVANATAIGFENELNSIRSLLTGSNNFVDEDGQNLLIFGLDHEVNAGNRECFYGGEAIQADDGNRTNFAFGNLIETGGQNQYTFGTGDLTGGTALSSPNSNSFLVGFDGNRVLYVEDGFVGIETTSAQGTAGGLIGGTPAMNEVLGIAGDVSADAYYSSSDKKWKRNIEQLNKPLEIISSLKGYQYEFRNDEFPDRNFDEAPTYGLLAQELDEVYPYAVRQGKDGMFVNYDALTALFVEAINAQQQVLRKQDSLLTLERTQNQEHEIRLQQQEQAIAQLQERLSELEANKSQIGELNDQSQFKRENTRQIRFEESDEKKAHLFEAEPNPFGQETRIRYYLPDGFRQAQIRIFDANARLIKKVTLNEPGIGSLILDAAGLQMGSYIYELIVDGQSVNRYQMVRISNF